jgi:uncharacterized membrane protein YhiD involved in acid resistance
MTGLYIYLNLGLTADISRIGALVDSGLGFIGAGTIIVTKNRTRPRAHHSAGLWTAGIIGLPSASAFMRRHYRNDPCPHYHDIFCRAVNGFKRAAESGQAPLPQ